MRDHALPLLLALALVLAGCSGATNSGAPAGADLGLAAGGAADATAFRNNVERGYVPQPTDMTAEGLFHDYYFDTGRTRECEALFCPTYSRAVSRDPLSNETDRYLTVAKLRLQRV